MNSMLKLKKPTRLEWVILITIGVIVAFVGLWWLINTIVDSQKTYPLGDKLEYIGRQETTCPSGFTPEGFKFGFCEKKVTYYYATDMSVDEFKQYFRDTENQDPFTGTQFIPADWPGPLQGLTIHNVNLVIKGTNFSIDPTYVDNLTAVSERIPLRASSKKHLVLIKAEDYKPLLRQTAY
jgi:hypothetical protein